MPKPITPPRCPSRHRERHLASSGFVWCAECGALRYVGSVVSKWKHWQYPKYPTRRGT